MCVRPGKVSPRRCALAIVATGRAASEALFGGDVIRGFVFAMLWGVFVGAYSTVYVAKNIVLWLGVKRDWSKPDPKEKLDEIPSAFREGP